MRRKLKQKRRNIEITEILKRRYFEADTDQANVNREVSVSNYISNICELSNSDHVLGIVLQTKVSGRNRTHNPHAKNLAHYSLDYHGTQHKNFLKNFV